MSVATGLAAESREIGPSPSRWRGVDLGSSDRSGGLTTGEVRALEDLGPQGLRRRRSRGVPRRTAPSWRALERLVHPLDAARCALHCGGDARHRRGGLDAVALVLEHSLVLGRSYWAWSEEEWAEFLSTDAEAFLAARSWPCETTVRPFTIAIAYLVAGFDRFDQLGRLNRLSLARLLFGDEDVEASIATVATTLDAWGYRAPELARQKLRGVVGHVLLVNHSPFLEDLSTDAFARLRTHPATSPYQLSTLYALQRGVAALGHCEAPARTGTNAAPVIEGAHPDWIASVERWHATSTLTPKVRAIIRTIMAKAGRWLSTTHPQITLPAQWTRETCAAWVAAIDRMAVGDYVQRREALGKREGKPITPRTKSHLLMATRTFFRDYQEWEWIPRRFDPNRALALPRNVSALIATDPRVIADELWAKLLWAGLNLEPGDLPGNSADTYYPMELIRALTLTWLFAGLRSDEICRLRVGCIRWQREGRPIPADADDVLAIGPEDPVARVRAPRLGQHARVRVEPQRPHRQPTARSKLANHHAVHHQASTN